MSARIKSDDLPNRLRSLRAGLSRREFAKLVGVHENTLGGYERGERSPDWDFLTRLRDKLDVNLNWLVQGNRFYRENPPGAIKSSEKTVVLPRFDVRASAGAGALVAIEEVSEYFAVGRDWLRRNLPPWAPLDAVVGILENGGDSMEPTVRDGDLLMVVQVTDWRVVERGGIFVFTHHDRLHLKRLQVLMNGDLKVISDNKAYEPWLVPFDDIQHSIRLLGQVFFAGGKPRTY